MPKKPPQVVMYPAKKPGSSRKVKYNALRERGEFKYLDIKSSGMPTNTVYLLDNPYLLRR